jgi:uroporphyrinogen decarboxylase
MHNNGEIWNMLDQLVNIGIDGYHPVVKAASMDMVIVKHKAVPFLRIRLPDI